MDEVHAITGNAVALTIGIVTALWAGLGVVQATQNAMNQIWDVPRKDRPNFFISRLRSLLMLFVLGITLLASTFFSGLATARSNGAVLVTWEVGLSLLFNLVLFLLVYRVLTRLDLRWRDVLPGAIAAAVLWTALQWVGGYYVEHTIKRASNVYGTLALVIGLLVWIYLAGQLTLLCAEINVVRVRGSGLAASHRRSRKRTNARCGPARSPSGGVRSNRSRSPSEEEQPSGAKVRPGETRRDGRRSGSGAHWGESDPSSRIPV